MRMLQEQEISKSYVSLNSMKAIFQVQALRLIGMKLPGFEINHKKGATAVTPRRRKADGSRHIRWGACQMSETLSEPKAADMTLK